MSLIQPKPFSPILQIEHQSDGIYLDPGVFPPSLRYLKLNRARNSTLEPNILPEGLLEFELTDSSMQFENGSLPPSLEALGICDELVTMLASLAVLPNLSKLICNSLTSIQDLAVNEIPPSVKWIIIRFFEHTIELDDNSSSLTIERLEINRIFSHDHAEVIQFLPGYFPNT